MGCSNQRPKVQIGRVSTGSLFVRYSKYDLSESLMESASSPSPSKVDLPLGNAQTFVSSQLTILLLHLGDLEA